MGHEKHLLWGTFTWILFHWMSVQIKERYFVEERDNLVNIIKEICENLPCPSCRDHAKEYMKNVPLKYVTSRQELIDYVYHFHNSVNMRGKKQFQPDSILEKYTIVNFSLLIKSWDANFVLGHYIQKHDFMAKQRITTLKNKVKAYFSEKSHKFLMS